MTYQLTAPLLDACVLGIVQNEDAYGYTLTQKAKQVVDISESTLYPVLRRLQKSGMLSTYDIPYQGRNRRYYAITAEGSKALEFYRTEWVIYSRNISDLLGVTNIETAEAVTKMNEADTKQDTCEIEDIDIQTKEAPGFIESKNEEGDENE